MGDRTYVTLTLLTAHVSTLEQLLDSDFESVDIHKDITGFIHYGFSEVNYGNLEFEPQLVTAGIAYTKRWLAGSDYGAGVLHCRFTPEGDLQSKEAYDDAENPPLAELVECIDDHEKLKTIILAYKEKVTPLPWDNQEEYGKIYLTKKLIQPQE